jgi:hypothetical protein
MSENKIDAIDATVVSTASEVAEIVENNVLTVENNVLTVVVGGVLGVAVVGGAYLLQKKVRARRKAAADAEQRWQELSNADDITTEKDEN